MGILASNFPSSLLLATMLLLATWKLAHAVEQITVRLSTFHLIMTANSISHTSVNRTFDKTDSVLHCGMQCSNIMVPSFYFVEQTSTCYCSNYHNPDIEVDTGQSSITYGLLRQGNSSECQALYDTGARADGVYTDTTGEQMFCNMTALGWVVFQRRQDGSVGFHRNWTDYVDGFGDPNGEFWLGLDALHLATQTGCELHIYLEAEPNNIVQDKGFARYSSFSVSGATDNYMLYVGGYAGNVGDSLAVPFHDGRMFSTYDNDNDVMDFGNRNCAQTFGGGWWFSRCFKSNLNGAYLGGNHAEYALGINWETWRGYHYSLLRTEMAYAC